ncbi:MAG TPA: alpha-hydroxy-acid oxidizing protein [Terriglobales bacterium]|nr:alpha-hydroxy-acid oxidizing protein [Terriglobales bacterium]
MQSKAALAKFSGVERQLEIYQAGLMGAKPTLPVSPDLLEQKAKEVLEPRAYDYVAGAAGGEQTARANREAFYGWRIVPRMLRDVSERDLSVELLGKKLPAPLLLGPVGVQGIIHAEAELATARAAASLGVPSVLSTLSSQPLEQVAQACGDGPRWFQLYWTTHPEVTASLLRRAEAAGYSALVVTLDTSILGWRERDLRHPYLPFLLGEGLANFFTDPVFRSLLPKPPQQDPVAAIRLWGGICSHTALTWKDLNFLRQHTRVPILLKGILRVEDAEQALASGVDGLVVSNHGGRQVDGAIAALDALPAVVRAVKGRVPVLFDSGIRRGADALKALALGARAVLLGRLYIWGLAAGGEQGVRETLLNFLADFDLTLALSGYRCCAELNEAALARTVGTTVSE